MRIALDGRDEVRVATPPDEVADALADPRELRDMLDGMIRPTSTLDRWVMAEVGAGPVSLTPAVDVVVERRGPAEVAILGRPVAGHTAAHLDITLVAHPDDSDQGSLIVSGWRLAIDVSGPQVLAPSIRPLVVAGSRSATRRLAERLQRRFGRPTRT